jgi:hypothetical protein
MNAYLFTQQHGLRIGDRLITEKGPVSRHHAIFVQIPGGLPLVAENQVGKGVQYITLEEFCPGMALEGYGFKNLAERKWPERISLLKLIRSLELHIIWSTSIVSILRA